jgi:plastocyanin
MCIKLREVLGAVLLVTPLAAIVACGSYGGPSPMGSEGLTAAPAGAVVINVVGQAGARSYSPDPATVPAGATVTWHNVDSVVHRVVLDDGRLDSGNISPARFSAAMTLAQPGGYHCSIHPSMVGTIRGQ